jgi:hypothetical protein
MRRLAIVPVLLTAALLLVGCSVGAHDESLAPQPGVVAPEDGGAVGGGDVVDEDRDVIVNGSVTVTADDPLAAAEDAVRIVESAGGRIDGRTEYAPTRGDRGSATLTLRIPAERLNAVLADLKELGRADEVSISSYDVTVETKDLEARISSLRASIERLNGFLAQADDVDQLIALESQLTTRQGELESLEAQQRVLADQVAMSTISLYLRSEAEAPDTAPDDFWSGLAAGWAGFVAFWAGLLVALGVALPWLVALGIIAVIAILVVRRATRALR